ncbi:SubName: Full=Related to kinesin light chain {ECO:0000313/EMBL:CCA75937.1} [Serendipita indica DSM 11827]|nr:SubName: Full=Related to kinesin light chain {ECO:0000313/EMBL:CCA75937.1} [Serendipita indica DSM 11827]
MSGLSSGFRKIIPLPKSSLRDVDQPMSSADSDNEQPSTSNSKSKIDHLGFLELAPGTDPLIDIVAIHGLDGHREETWETDGVLWLRDLVPSELPRARILTYGYDADTQSAECVSTQTMYRHADEFAKALARKRKDVSRRPIIFVTHDLGGIILKWALVICHNQRLDSECDLRDVLISTHAILFFGTPHTGIESEVSILDAVKRLAASVRMETTDTIVKDLRSHSSELENVQKLYVEASAKVKSVFFCEEYKTHVDGNRRRLNVSHHSAVIAGDRNATTVVLHANHEALVQFSAAEGVNYQSVLYYLQKYLDSAPTAVCEQWATEDSCRRAAKGEPASEEVMLPKPCPPVSRGYVERQHLQSLITQKLLPKGRVKHQPRCILHGIGGAGKTQLATNWIQENELRFTRVIFVDASSQTQLETDLRRSIRSLGSEYSKMTWKDAVTYLDGKERGWLLFVDNADSAELNLRPYLPTSIHGAVLITTRNSQRIDYAPDGAVAVGALEESEAVKLLHTTANVSPVSNAESVEIVNELGMLALAVTQAGVYIRQTRRLTTYLDTFRKSRNRLLSKQPDIGSEYTSSTYTAFDLSFHKLQTRTQDFIKLCAFLHHSLIPLALFERSTTSGFSTYTVLEECPPPESDKIFISKLQEILGETWDEVAFQDIVDSAAQASFINVSTDGAFYSIHPLLQMYIQDSLGTEDKGDFVRMTLQLLLGAIRPAEESNAPLWHLLPHASSIPRSVVSENLAHILAFDVLYDALGNWRACWELLEYSLERVRAKQGERHSNTMWAMSKLAEALWHCGQLSKAEKMQRDTLALQLEILGRENHDTIRTMHCLALTLRGRGQLDEAEKMQRDVLALRLEISGPRHPGTITAMNNLALTL